MEWFLTEYVTHVLTEWFLTEYVMYVLTSLMHVLTERFLTEYVTLSAYGMVSH